MDKIDSVGHISCYPGWVLSQALQGQDKFIKGDGKGAKRMPPPVRPSPAPPSPWQYISESAWTEASPPGQEAVGMRLGWLRWMCAAGMRQKLPVAALFQFPSLAWQLSITLQPLPVNYTNAGWQAASPAPIGKATQRTCSDDITAGPHRKQRGRVSCHGTKVINRSTNTHMCTSALGSRTSPSLDFLLGI